MQDPRHWALAVVVCVALLGAHAADWPQFGGPDASGVSPESGIARNWPEAGPAVLWTVALAPGYGGAAVRDGEVYVLDRPTDGEDVLLCLDLHSGSELWRCAYGAPGKPSFNGTRSTPTVDDGHVYTMSPLGHVTCISRRDHGVVWSHYLKLKFGRMSIPRWGFGHSPVLYNGMVIVILPDLQRQKNGTVAAFDALTGELRWRSQTVGITRMCFATPRVMPVVGRDQLLFFVHDEMMRNPLATLVSMDPAGGEVLWRLRTHRSYNIPIPQPISLGGDRIFVAGGYELGCFSLQVARRGAGYDVSPRFEHQKCSPHIQTPVFYRGHIYAQSFDGYHGEAKNGLLCMDPDDGDVLWKTGPDTLFDNGALLIADDVMFVMHGMTGVLSLVAAEPDGFKRFASAQVFPPADRKKNESIWSPMALSDRKLLVRNFHQLKCLDVAAVARGYRNDGSGVYDSARPPVNWVDGHHVKWAARVPGRGGPSATATSDKVFLTTATPPGLRCYDADSGSLEWQHRPGGRALSASACVPLVANDAVYAVFGNGAVLCCSVAGELQWSVDLRTRAKSGENRPFVSLADGVLLVSLDRMHGMDPKTGRTVWTVKAKSPVAEGPPAMVRVDGSCILVTSGGAAIRASDGEMLSGDLAVSHGVPPVSCGDGTYVVCKSPAGAGQSIAAYRIASAGSSVGAQEVWSHGPAANRYACAPAVSPGSAVYAMRRDGTLEKLDARTGEVLEERALGAGAFGTREGGGPSLLVAGEKLYVCNVGERNQTFVLSAGELDDIWRYEVEGGGPEPSFCGRSQYIRSGASLYCVRGRTPRPPAPLAVATVPSEQAPRGGRAPCVLADMAMPSSWLFCGPFGPGSIETDFLDDIGGRARLRPSVGQIARHGAADITFAELSDGCYWEHVRFTAGLRSIDITGATGGQGECTAYLYTVITNETARYVRLRLLTPGGEAWHPPGKLSCAAWLASKRIAEGEVLRLMPGTYPLMIQVQLGKHDGRGKIWFAPRFEELGEAFTQKLRNNEEQARVWQAHQAEGDQIFVLRGTRSE